MKKPVVDYREFRLSRLKEPRFSHLWLLLGWVGYFLLFILTERLIPADRCIPVKLPVDDLIPFCAWFVVPYVFWYVLLAGSVVYYLLYDIEGFKKLQTYLIVTQVVAVAAYILIPTRQDLRPETFANDNVLTRLVGLLYTVDTNTGVCPSIHVAHSVALLSVWLRDRQAAGWWKAFVAFSSVMICLSTMLIKQHSAMDVLAALPVCLLAEVLVFSKRTPIPWLRKG